MAYRVIAIYPELLIDMLRGNHALADGSSIHITTALNLPADARIVGAEWNRILNCVDLAVHSDSWPPLESGEDPCLALLLQATRIPVIVDTARLIEYPFTPPYPREIGEWIVKSFAMLPATE